MNRVESIHSRCVILPRSDVDTDQIIPARFLKVTTRAGLGRHLFADWRYDASGAPRPDFPLHHPDAAAAQVLVAGANFGCGSSREHAPWALIDYGFRAVVSTSIADIFRSNALKNGLLPVVVDGETHAKLIAAGGAPVTIDLRAQTIALGDGTVASFPVDGFARHCLLNGVDELGFLLEQEEAIAAFEARRA
jgi:3-isopropylmalate/(R)-2-methylmalate dehydratase small subunit